MIDECHRGSAAADSAWREVLEYFNSATQIGLTATPKETRDVSNIDYFGEPLYTYSLKQGIEDGFLAPYKVIRFDLDKDLMGYRPERGTVDRYGHDVEDRIYNQRDFDRNLVLDQRTALVADKITEFLTKTNRFDKAIVFCEDTEHAERMRQALANANADLLTENHRYVMRITGDDQAGKAELDNFIDPKARYPVIATTSKLSLDRRRCQDLQAYCARSTHPIDDRVQADHRPGHPHRRKNTASASSRSWTSNARRNSSPTPISTVIRCRFTSPAMMTRSCLDDEPADDVSIEIDGEEIPVTDITWDGDDDADERPRKLYLDNVTVDVLAKRVQYLGPDGKLITESLRSYTKKTVRKDYRTLDDFLRRWADAEKKQAIIEELEGLGVSLDGLREEVKNGEQFSAFDLLCHVAYGQPPLTRRERAEQVKKRNYFAKYEGQARVVLEALLDKYADEDFGPLENATVPAAQTIRRNRHAGRNRPGCFRRQIRL